MKAISIIFIILSFLKWEFLTPKNYEEKIAEEEVIVEFWAPWNAKGGLPIAEIEDIEAEGIKYYRVSIEQYPELAEKYNVYTLPEFILYVDGVEYDRIRGNLKFERKVNSAQLKQKVKHHD